MEIVLPRKGRVSRFLWSSAISKYEVTTLWLTAPLFNMVVEEAPEALKDVEQLLTGGEALSVAHVRRALERLPSTQLINGYGPTESTTFTCCSFIPKELSGAVRSIPIGRAIGNTQVYLLDAHLQPVPIGVAAELYLGGEGLARGYLNRPELTAERFVPHPWSAEPGARLYKTGDLARYLPDGRIEYLGRLDQQVKLRGYRIELGEIEAVLNQHPGVRECLVLVHEEAPGDKRLVAYVVAHSQQEVSGSELRSFLQAKLPEYMLPAAFVMLEAWPLTPNGKIDRQALPAPGRAKTALQEAFVAPRNALELQLVQIWEAILCIHPIGVTENFFAFGGHSLLAVRLMAQIQEQFGKNIPLSILFQGGTIEHLASALQQHDISLGQSPLVAIQPHGSRRPFFCVHPGSGQVLCYYKLALHLGLDQPFYGLQDPDIYGEDVLYTPPIEDMATHYIEVLRGVQKEGPYLLGGYSFGGIVAFEMAQQLQRQGHEVALLAILDSGSPDISKFVELDDAYILAGFAIELMRDSTQKNLQELYDDLKVLEYQEQLNYVLEQMKMANLEIPRNGPLELHHEMQLFKTRMQATRNYVPQVYSGQVTLFRTSKVDNVEHIRLDPELSKEVGWGKLSTRPLEIHDIPGFHDEILSDPYVKDLAEKLQVCLGKAGGFEPIVNSPAR